MSCGERPWAAELMVPSMSARVPALKPVRRTVVFLGILQPKYIKNYKVG